LFAGPSGTGKSLAAEVVAAELLLPLWRVDLSRVVSKYIGETERNLSEIFAAAESSGVMLLFDEADALFGKRSEVNDSHDRYANLEISFLLQRMEVYDGIAVLSTNLLGHVDDAFARRLTATVHFPFPDPALRKRLWEQVWPDEAPVADDLEFDELAEKYELTGGNIRNIAVAAATTAASDGRVIRMVHVVDAIAREFRKLGRSTTPAEECAT
jgi:SpoVK/Ycf46/Vps4 family AAA+-type ATPase